MSARKTPRTPFRPGRLIVAAVALAVLSVIALLGWRSVAGIPIRQVVVHGAVQADREALLDLARIPVDSTLLSVSPPVVADRVRRHPWVREARVSRLPTGTVSIRVTERTPTLLVLSPGGAPAYYIDAEGYRMPWTGQGAWPVPVVRDLREPYHPVSPVHTEAVRRLAASVTDLDPDLDALLSEFHVEPDGGVRLTTTPSPDGRTLSVRLGRTGFAQRFERLHAFWNQVVLARPGVRYAWIDLRFDSQIVTRESS